MVKAFIAGVTVQDRFAELKILNTYIDTKKKAVIVTLQARLVYPRIFYYIKIGYIIVDKTNGLTLEDKEV